MLNIILLFQSKNNNTDILNYLKHINNINSNVQLEILITIINTNKNLILDKTIFENTDFQNNKNNKNNVNVNIYNYSCNYTDELYNEIVSNSIYDLLLFSSFDIYLSESVLEFILLNKIKENSFVRSSILELNNIPDVFYNNYDANKFFNSVATNIEYIINENNRYKINTTQFIEIFNQKENDNIINLNYETIKNNDLYYLHNSNDFFLIQKKTLQNFGFNIDNTNIDNTFQYCILNLIKNNLIMIKLPVLLSVYKKQILHTPKIIDINNKFSCICDFNKNINYKLYDLKSNTIKSFIRNHIKVLNGVNNNDLKNINKKLNHDNSILLEENKKLNTFINEQEITLQNYIKKIEEINVSKNILIQKIKQQECDYQLLKDNYSILKSKYIDKLKIINSSINQIIVNEINNFEI